jgi:hypothetical protein
MQIITYGSNTYAAWNAGDQMIIINVSVLNNCWREVRRRARGDVRTCGAGRGPVRRRGFAQSPMGCWGVIPCSQATLPRILRKARWACSPRTAATS